MTRPRLIRLPVSCPVILPGLRAVLDAVDRLLTNPRPAGSFPFGSPDVRRLRVGRYRVLYEITGDVITAGRIARVKAPG
jgi:mRNA interferase RelE/StbE